MTRLYLSILGAAALAATLVAQTAPGTPAKVGHASFTVGGKPVTYDHVEGQFMDGYGFHTISLVFTPDGKPTSDNLALSVMIQKPGPVDLNQGMGNGIQIRVGGTIYAYQKGKSQCTMTVTAVTATSVAGTAECPVLVEAGGEEKASLTAVKFSATTK